MPNLEQLLDRAMEQHQAGELRAAEQLYLQILSAAPDYADALHLLGVLRIQQDRPGEAIPLIQRALQANPSVAGYLGNLGLAYANAGDLPRAIATYQQALALQPDYPQAAENLAAAYLAQNHLAAAETAAARALAIAPQSPDPHNLLGRILVAQSRFKLAAASFTRALSLQPGDPVTLARLGDALWRDERPADAIPHLQSALQRNPNLPEAHLTLGNCHVDRGETAEAIACFDRAIAVRPDFAEAHYNLANMLLLQQDFARAWREYEWRWKVPNFPARPRSFVQPRWDGSPLIGQTLLVHAEQGFGDAMQFARFIPLTAERAANIIFECQPELAKLSPSLPGVTVVPRGQPLPPFDVWCPLLSLPLVLGSREIPPPIRLSADAAALERWRSRILRDHHQRVGLAWRGSPVPDPRRSIDPAALAPLGDIPNLSFHSLQADAGPPPPITVVDHAQDLTDFNETAALIQQLDLVITIDTAVAHLAGALGVPTFVLLHTSADWRWLRSGDRTPWYPGFKLFRQHSPGEWSNPVASLVTELRQRFKV